MRLDVYQSETERTAHEQSALLDEARQKLLAGSPLSPLEQAGVLHALQVLIENAIGKAKQVLKSTGAPIPISAYDAFANLAIIDEIDPAELDKWNQVVGIRNRIVHDYMNLDTRLINQMISAHEYQFVVSFLLRRERRARP